MERKHACIGAKTCSNRYPTGQGEEEYKSYDNVFTIKSELKHRHYIGTYIFRLSADGICVHRWHSEICNNVYGFYRINKVHCCEAQIGPFGTALFTAALNSKALVGEILEIVI